MKQRFFFTFGTSESFPFRGGWVEVLAEDYHEAIEIFRKHFPDQTMGIVNCSSIYTEEYFKTSQMASGNLGATCHAVIEV